MNEREEKKYDRGELQLMVQAFLLNPDNFLKYKECEEAENEGDYVEFEALDRLPREASDYVIRVYEHWLADGRDIDEPISIPGGSSGCENCYLFGSEVCLGCGHACSLNHISQLCIGNCHAGTCHNETVNCPVISHVCIDCLSIKCEGCKESKYNQNGGYTDSCEKCSYPRSDCDSDSVSD